MECVAFPKITQIEAHECVAFPESAHLEGGCRSEACRVSGLKIRLTLRFILIFSPLRLIPNRRPNPEAHNLQRQSSKPQAQLREDEMLARDRRVMIIIRFTTRVDLVSHHRMLSSTTRGWQVNVPVYRSCCKRKRFSTMQLPSLPNSGVGLSSVGHCDPNPRALERQPLDSANGARPTGQVTWLFGAACASFKTSIYRIQC